MSELHDRLSAFAHDSARMSDLATSCGIQSPNRPNVVYDRAISTVIGRLITYVDNDTPLRYLISATRNPRFQGGLGSQELFTAAKGSPDELTTLVFEKDVPAGANQFAQAVGIEPAVATQALMVATAVVASGLVELCDGDVSAETLSAIVEGERRRLADSPIAAVATTGTGGGPSKGVLIGGGLAALVLIGGLFAVLGGGGGETAADGSEEAAIGQGENDAEPTTTAVGAESAAETNTPGDGGSETAGGTESKQPDDGLAFAEPDDEPADEVFAERSFSIAVPMQDITDTNPNASGVFNFTFDNETGEVCYEVEAVDIEGPYRSHIHVGGAEEKGGIVIDFGPTVDGTTGCLANLPVETAAILANQTGHYAELHDISEEYTVRGQLSDASGDGHDHNTHDHGSDGSGTDNDDGKDADGDGGASSEAVVDIDGGGATTVLDNGTIILEGPVPDQETADRLFNAVNRSRQASGSSTPIVNNLQVVAGAPLPSGKIVIADAIFFEIDSSAVKAIDQVTIDAVTVLAKSRPDWILTVVGHTDSTGSDVYNLELSLARAGAVRDLLISLGIPADKLLVRGAGETAPIGDNGTTTGKAQNRRIEFEFKPAS